MTRTVNCNLLIINSRLEPFILPSRFTPLPPSIPLSKDYRSSILSIYCMCICIHIYIYVCICAVRYRFATSSCLGSLPVKTSCLGSFPRQNSFKVDIERQDLTLYFESRTWSKRTWQTWIENSTKKHLYGIQYVSYVYIYIIYIIFVYR